MVSDTVILDIFRTTLRCHRLNTGLGPDTDDAVARCALDGLRRPLPANQRLIAVHLDASLRNAIDSFKAAL